MEIRTTIHPSPASALPDLYQSAAALQAKVAQLEIECRSLKISERHFRSLIEHASDVIAVMNRRGDIEYCSPAWERVLDYELKDIIGKNFRSFLHPSDRKRVLRSIAMFLERPGATIHREFRIRRMDGRYQHMEGTVTNCLTDPGLQGIIVNAHDITERVRMEAFFRASLREKETLIKEIHHRVKNNLQLISSMLGLQAHHIHDESVAKIFRESKNRIKSMALIHEKLYQSKGLARIDVPDYLVTLIGHLIGSLGPRANNVRFTHELGEITLDIDVMIHLGLLINEIVTNSLKHAFSGERPGTIHLSAGQTPEGGSVTLCISDDGCGMPEGIRLDRAETLGLQLISMLGQQLGASITLECGPSGSGTAYRIMIPVR